MSFNLIKEDTPKKVNTNTVFLEDADDFVIEKQSAMEDNLGEEYLVDPEDPEDEDEQELEEELEAEEGDEIFEEDPSNNAEMTQEEIQQEKAKYLYQLNRLIKRGFASTRRFGMEHSLDDIRGEVFRIKKEIDVDSGVDYCRQGLMFCISTIEMVDGNYNLGVGLTGWSQNVMGNIESYDEVFAELYEKYATKVNVGPEIKLITMLAGSAFMFSMQKRMMNNEPVPQKQREMEGPSFDTDELLRELNEEVDLDNISDISEDEIKIVPEIKNISIKKRGRKSKNT